MVAHGRVENGVIVLEAGIRLPEGQKVTVLIPEAKSAAQTKSHSILDIPTISLGPLLRPLEYDDLLGEMLEGRK